MSAQTIVYDPPPSPQGDERVCESCRRDPDAVWFPILNSHSGKYHSGGEYGITYCGKDATGEVWLWPM